MWWHKENNYKVTVVYSLNYNTNICYYTTFTFDYVPNDEDVSLRIKYKDMHKQVAARIMDSVYVESIHIVELSIEEV